MWRPRMYKPLVAKASTLSRAYKTLNAHQLTNSQELKDIRFNRAWLSLWQQMSSYIVKSQN